MTCVISDLSNRVAARSDEVVNVGGHGEARSRWGRIFLNLRCLRHGHPGHEEQHGHRVLRAYGQGSTVVRAATGGSSAGAGSGDR
jgi:hypothetical protein